LRFSKTAPAAQHPPANWSKLGGSRPAANWRDLRVSKISHSFPGNRRKEGRFEILQNGARELAGPARAETRAGRSQRPSPPSSTGECPRRRDPGPVRPGRPPPPSKRPALPGPLMGRY
jgi:hypothetical protein